jgi:hypothetical protein
MTHTRTVGYTDFMIGMTYHIPTTLAFMEPYAGAEVGIVRARARSDAYGTRTLKVGDSTETFIVVDTQGRFHGSKTNVSVVVGTTLKVYSAVMLRAEAKYKLAKMGKLNGGVTRLGEKREEQTSIEFDLSGIILSIGVGVEF